MSGFRLVRLPAAEPATALLLLGPDAEAVLAARAAVRDARLFAVEEGVLVVAAGPIRATGGSTAVPIDRSVPGAIRLRRATERGGPVFVPVDAELVPALVPEESRALASERGLVFLPGDRVLSYRAGAPLDVAALVHVGVPVRRSWRSLPERPARAERLVAIHLESPPEAPEAILRSGAPPASAPGEEGAGAGAGDRASFALGKALFRAGEALNLDALKKAGAKWLDGLLSKAPSLGENVLGRQEAALRDLLNKLRSGDIEDALRRALPLPEPGGGRGARAASDAQLPVNDLAYSLRNVLGGDAKGPASVWFGGFDLQRELAAEYRKAAEKALEDGDHRRAAFIYGKLLRDYRQAAHVLAQAGLHRDAAILYLEKCDDKLAAARAFQAAGEVDRAVELYREKREHLLAGDLLRETGDEDGAVVEYERQADALAGREDWLGAADVLTQRARRNDLAIACLEKGWALRGARPTFACGTRLVELCAQESDTERLLAVVVEAERTLAVPGRDVEASAFWGTVARLPESRHLAPELASELRDRAKLGIAHKLRQRAEWDTRPARVLTEILGAKGPWDPAFVADARAAVDAAIKGRRAPTRETLSRTKVANGIVTAVACAPGPGFVFLGMANGEIHRFGAEDRSAARLSLHHPVVTALACDATGRVLVAVRGEGPRCELTSYSRRVDGPYFLIETRGIAASGDVLLSNVSDALRAPRIVVWDGEKLDLLDCPQLRHIRTLETREEPPAALLMAGEWPLGPDGALVFADDRVAQKPLDVFLGWTPDVPWGVSVHAPIVSWLEHQDCLDVVSLSEAGVISWASFPLADWMARSSVAHRAAGYLAVTLVAPGRLAAVTSSAIEWLEVSGGEIERTSLTPIDAKNAVACFHLDATREVAVVTADGVVLCAHVPGN